MLASIHPESLPSFHFKILGPSPISNDFDLPDKKENKILVGWASYFSFGYWKSGKKNCPKKVFRESMIVFWEIMIVSQGGMIVFWEIMIVFHESMMVFWDSMIVFRGIIMVKKMVKEYGSISREYDSISWEYDGILRQYDSISRDYNGSLKEYGSISREYDSISRE